LSRSRAEPAGRESASQAGIGHRPEPGSGCRSTSEGKSGIISAHRSVVYRFSRAIMIDTLFGNPRLHLRALARSFRSAAA
jgi:hypothetical protein